MSAPARPLVLPDDAHNRGLLRSVRPADWRNPAPAARYSLVVIGAGTAGLVSAAAAASLGARVALVERGLLGGDCLNVGCVPSKALLRAAKAAAAVRAAGEFGVRVPAGWSVDFAAVMERLRRLRAGIAPHDSAERFRRLGVDVFLGEAGFVAEDAVEVAGTRLPFRRAVIATGARAAAPPIPGLAEAGFLTNENLFWLTEIPRRLLVIGGGPIGCEMAQAFARLGSTVTLVDVADRVLPRDDPDGAALLRARLASEGVRFLLGTKVLRAAAKGSEKAVTVAHGGQEEALAADAVLVAVGRAPNVDGLQAEAAGVRVGRGGVEVDDRLRTANPRVYAAGDCCSAWKFTHAADAMARIVVRNAFFLGRARASALVIPWCTYTDPEVGHVGLTSTEVEARHGPVRAITVPLEDVDRAVLDGEPEGFVKVLTAGRSDRILGATVVARHASGMIGELSLAITHRLGLRALSATIHPYPTVSEALRKAGDEWQRSRLTPRVRRMLGWLARRGT
ncbi:MAG: mercuric reductase [Planctomycetales bacterium]|nr:mercuric reductase [Planctomycetales bacterium]